jgi:hypothetical protein
MPRCYACHENLPVDAFARDGCKASGRVSICKQCDNERSRVRYERKCALLGLPTPKRHHGMSQSPTHVSWASMKRRVLNRNDVSWHLYGGRGITMCDQWRDSFQAFLADMGERPPGTTLDRIDPEGNYEPGNCRWATPGLQRQNQRHRRAAA